MIPRLDPAIPLVWRDPHTLQLGVDRVVCVFPNVAVATQRMLAALQRGAPESALTVLASADPSTSAKDAPAEAGALLASVSDALLPDSLLPDGSVRTGSIVIDGTGETAARLHRLLREAGHHVITAREAAAMSETGAEARAGAGTSEGVAAAVLVGSFMIPPWRHGSWLRRDVPHLPIVFSDDGVEIGPFVDGDGPCLRCVSLARTDADPAWPAIAAQLDMRPPAPEPCLLSARAAAVAAHWLDARVREGDVSRRATSIRLRADGSVSERSHSPHGLCGCRALPENVTALVGRPRSRTSSTPADASLA